MFTLSPLPFDLKSLEPHMSSRTLEFHYGKHHQAYVDNLNKLIVGTDLETSSLEDIIKKTAGSVDKAAIFNNAAQVYNHNIFWQSLRPTDASLEPPTALLDLINTSFGSLDDFYREFKTAALAQFGSGWIWLVKDGDSLKIMKMANAENPLTAGFKPVLALDVWEHSYYLDYQNRRGNFVEAVMRNLFNWSFAQSNL